MAKLTVLGTLMKPKSGDRFMQGERLSRCQPAETSGFLLDPSLRASRPGNRRNGGLAVLCSRPYFRRRQPVNALAGNSPERPVKWGQSSPAIVVTLFVLIAGAMWGLMVFRVIKLAYEGLLALLQGQIWLRH